MIADHIEDLGPARCFWAIPMERYIGILKNMVSLMSNIDMNLALRVITLEHTNHLFLRRSLLPNDDNDGESNDLCWNSTYPRPGVAFLGEISPTILKLLRARFWHDRLEFPVKLDRIAAYQKYHLKWRLSIGSQYSQSEYAINRRDDSYITWRLATQPDSALQYARVVLFVHLYDWEAIAIIQPIRQVAHSAFKTTRIVEDLGRMQSIKVSEIVGAAGRISKHIGNHRVTYLVSEYKECEFFPPKPPVLEVLGLFGRTGGFHAFGRAFFHLVFTSLSVFSIRSSAFI
jgi:hypothetical protein